MSGPQGKREFCDCCDYFTDLYTYGEDSAAPKHYCYICAKTLLPLLKTTNRPLAVSLGWIANHILDEIRKTRG